MRTYVRLGLLLAATFFAAPAPPVLAQTAPANDDFANATVLGSDAGSLIGESNEDASAEAGEPTFLVTKTEDTDDGVCDDDCSLREAVVAANATGSDDTIHLPAGTYLLTLDWWGVADHFGSLDIEPGAGTTSILGEGRDTTVIDATTLRTLGLSNPDRVFKVGFGAGLELVGVTVTGGYTENATSADRDGGGIWNQNGTLTVTDCLIEGNVAGENGGGIANHYGTATITNTIIRDNNTDPPEYTTTGYGGGIYNSGTMTITDSTIELNASDFGGGIANEEVLEDYPPTLDISNSVITNNSAWRGGGVANVQEGTMILSDSTVSDNDALRGSTSSGSSNRGGGIWNAFGGVLTITDTAIEGNQVMATHAVHPVDGSGGGIANLLATLNLSGTTVSGNTAICDQDITGDPDLCGRGGGIVNAGGEATIVNSTMSGNTTALLNSEHSPYLGGGGGGGLAHMPYRSGMYVWCPITILDSATITGNSADHGGGINTRWETKTGLLYDIDEWEVAPNVYECPFLYVTNTIVADNTATFTPGTEDGWGDYTSDGYNLVGDGTGCPADGPGDVTTVDPRLGPLADNGGPTLTHSLLATSPALDAGDTSLTVDQRGVTRPQGPADDIGAFEAPPASVGGLAELPDVSDSAGRNYVALAGLAAALVALGAGGWYARRRWLG